MNDNRVNIEMYRGEISKCTCTNASLDPAKPAAPVACEFCKCKGYVAQCLNCGGKGQTSEKVGWGAEGKMTVTCDICGGSGRIPSSAPSYPIGAVAIAQEKAEDKNDGDNSAADLLDSAGGDSGSEPADSPTDSPAGEGQLVPVGGEDGDDEEFSLEAEGAEADHAAVA